MKADGEAVEYLPHSTTPEELGCEIAKAGGIRQLGDRYVVPSERHHAGAQPYLVDVVEQTCTCSEYELTCEPCKHYEACMFWLAWEDGRNTDTGAVLPPTKRRPPKRDLGVWEAAQEDERERVGPDPFSWTPPIPLRS